MEAYFIGIGLVMIVIAFIVYRKVRRTNANGNVGRQGVATGRGLEKENNETR